jgi:hypothetical protein
MSKNLLLGLLATGGIIAGAPLIFPYGIFKSDLESKLSTLSNTKATIGSISFNYSPTPTFNLEHIILDTPETANIGSISIPVSTHNLLNLGERLRDVSINNAEFSRAFAIDIPNRLQPAKGDAVKIDRLRLMQVSVKLENGRVGPVDGQLRFKADGSIDDLLITGNDGRTELQVQPAEGSTFKVQFNAKGWASPLGYPVEFEYLKLIGIANTEGIMISDIRADLYGGLVTGSAQLNWNQGWSLNGQAFAKNLQAEPLLKVFSPITRASGRMNADGTFRYQGSDYNQLFKQGQIDGRFIIQDGMLHNFDLVTPLKSQSPTVQSRGGQTSFNTLVGGISINGKTVQLRGLALDAGKFRSRGELSIRENNLSGNIASQLAAGAVMVSNQLKVTGALNSPELRSGGAYRPSAQPAAPAEEPADLRAESSPQP